MDLETNEARPLPRKGGERASCVRSVTALTTPVVERPLPGWRRLEFAPRHRAKMQLCRADRRRALAIARGTLSHQARLPVQTREQCPAPARTKPACSRERCSIELNRARVTTVTPLQIRSASVSSVGLALGERAQCTWALRIADPCGPPREPTVLGRRVPAVR